MISISFWLYDLKTCKSIHLKRKKAIPMAIRTIIGTIHLNLKKYLIYNLHYSTYTFVCTQSKYSMSLRETIVALSIAYVLRTW